MPVISAAAPTVPEDSGAEDSEVPADWVGPVVPRWPAVDPVAEVPAADLVDLAAAVVDAAEAAGQAEVAEAAAVVARDADLAIATAMRRLSVIGQTAPPIASPALCSTPSATPC